MSILFQQRLITSVCAGLCLAQATLTIAAPPRPSLITEATTKFVPRKTVTPVVEPVAEPAGKPVVATDTPTLAAPVDDAGEEATEPVEETAAVPAEPQQPPETIEDWQLSQSGRKTWTQGDSQGNIIARGVYVHGKRDGVWQRYYAPGHPTFAGREFDGFDLPFSSESQFAQGSLNGYWKLFDANRRLVSYWEFRDGKPHGKITNYTAGGQVREQYTCKNGKIEGVGKVSVNGDGETRREEFANGLVVAAHSEADANGTLLVAGAYVDMSERRTVEFDWWQGVARIEVTPGVAEKQKHGTWTWRYDTGQKQLEGSYVEGAASGKFTWWHANGQQHLQGTYDEGAADGKFTWWHTNGIKKVTATYVMGSPVGVTTRWDTAGQITEEADAAIDPLAMFLRDPARF